MTWQEIPGGALTNCPITAVAAPDGDAYVFITGTDRQIYYNHLKGDSWTGWTILPGGARTSYSVAAAYDSTDALVVLHVGDNGHIYESSRVGSTWTPWSYHDEEAGTALAPTLLAVGDKLLSFYVAKDGLIHTQTTVTLKGQ